MKPVDVILCICAMAMVLMMVLFDTNDQTETMEQVVMSVDNQWQKLWKSNAQRSLSILDDQQLRVNTTNSTNSTNVTVAIIEATYDTVGVVIIGADIAATTTVTVSTTYYDATLSQAGTKTISAGVITQFIGTTTITATQLFTGAGSVQMGSATGPQSIVVLNAVVTFSTSGGTSVTNTRFEVTAPGSVEFSQSGAVAVSSLVMNLGAGTSVKWQAQGTASGLTVSGTSATFDMTQASASCSSTVIPSGNTWETTMNVAVIAANRRRLATSFASGASMTWCGDNAASSTTSILSGNGLIVDTSCSASSAGTLTIAAGGVLVFKNVDGSASTLTATSFSIVATSVIEVLTSSASDFDVSLIVYPGTTCSTVGTPQIDACTTGYTCSIYSSQSGSNCMIKFKSLQDVVPSGSNSGLYALLALLAIPVVAIVLFLLYKKHMKPVVYQETPPAYVDYMDPTNYPDTGYPVMNTPY